MQRPQWCRACSDPVVPPAHPPTPPQPTNPNQPPPPPHSSPGPRRTPAAAPPTHGTPASPPPTPPAPPPAPSPPPPSSSPPPTLPLPPPAWTTHSACSPLPPRWVGGWGACAELLYTSASSCIVHLQTPSPPLPRPPPPLLQYEGKYSASQPGPTYVYPSTQFEDDLAFAVGGWPGQQRGKCGGVAALNLPPDGAPTPDLALTSSAPSPPLPLPHRPPGCTAPPGSPRTWRPPAPTSSARRWGGGRGVAREAGGEGRGSHAVCCAPKLTRRRRPPPPPPPPQYSRNYFVSWDSVFIPADILLLSLGAGPVEGVDHAWQVDEFLASWQQGEHNSGVEGCGGGGGGEAVAQGAAADRLVHWISTPPPPLLPPPQARTASSSAPRDWRWHPSAAGAT